MGGSSVSSAGFDFVSDVAKGIQQVFEGREKRRAADRASRASRVRARQVEEEGRVRSALNLEEARRERNRAFAAFGAAGGARTATGSTVLARIGEDAGEESERITIGAGLIADAIRQAGRNEAVGLRNSAIGNFVAGGIFLGDALLNPPSPSGGGQQRPAQPQQNQLQIPRRTSNAFRSGFRRGTEV